MEKQTKKILSIDEQIQKLKSKNIKFNLISENETKQILAESTYFYKIYSYRKNFNYNSKTNEYINLDFKCLYDLSKFDAKIRYKILNFSLDVEHGLKTRLIKEISKNKKECESRNLIKDFLIKNVIEHSKEKRDEISEDILNKGMKDIINQNNFNLNLIEHKKIDNEINYKNWNIWEFVEIISFGKLIRLCKLYTDKYSYKICNFHILYNVKTIRN